MRALEDCDAFVLGRITYERFRENWGAGGNPYLDRISAMPKYVASRSLEEVTWNAALLGPDIVRAIQDLKGRPGKDLIKYGNSRLDLTLLRADGSLKSPQFLEERILPLAANSPADRTRRPGLPRAQPHTALQTG